MALNPRQMLGLSSNRPTMQFQQLNRAFQTDPRQILGQSLLAQGVSSAPVATPLQGLGRLSSALVGAFLQRKAGDAQVEREDQYRNQLASALSGVDMSSVPSLQALSEVNPELALPAAVTLESNIATQLAKNANKPVTNQFSAFNRVIELSNKPQLNTAETQELAGLTQMLERPTPITVGDGQGGTVQVLRPGMNVQAALSGQAPPSAAGADATTSGEGNGVPGGIRIGGAPAQLSTQESDFVSKAASAATDLQTVIDLMFSGDLYNGEYQQGVAIASGSDVGRAVQGADAQKLYDALSNLVDLRLRERTGATANPYEVEQYLEGITPGITTRPDAARAKIGRLVTEINAKIGAFRRGRNIPDLKALELPTPNTQDATNRSLQVNIPGT